MRTQVAVLLDSVPVFNILFFYTNIIGSGALGRFAWWVVGVVGMSCTVS